MKRMVSKCCRFFAMLLLLFAVPLLARQTPSAPAPSPSDSTKALNDKLVQLDQRVTAAQSSADNAWMLAIMMQSFMLMAVISVLWALVGYSLAFGGNGPVIGGFEHAFLRGVGADPNPDYAGTIPQSTFMIYQLMFAIITPALITGATAERMKFSGTVLFLILWFLVVYAPLAHMVWGKGGLLNAVGG